MKSMPLSLSWLLRIDATSLMLAMGAFVPTLTAAQTSQADAGGGRWQYSATVYGYFPSLSGATSAPTAAGGTPIDVSIDKILDHLQFTFMGTLEAHNGRWGGFTDIIYLNLGGSKQRSRDFTIGNQGVPASTTADLEWDLEGAIWTLAGEYRVVSDGPTKVDLLAGARMAQLKQSLNWSIDGDLGGPASAARFGSFSESRTLWDAIVGVKGRYAFGSSQRWSVPFYLDVGTGQSKLTWQAAAGISYAYSWGELSAMWRYLAYEMDSGANLKDLNFNGPMFGATFRW